MTDNSGLILIGCGLPRSGTMSTRTALEIILPGRCHHIVTAFDHQEEWRYLLSGKASDEEFREFFVKHNYSAAVDSPFCFIYERALKVFPNAKVLLTVRDPEKWNQSAKDTILKETFLPFPSCVFNYFRIFQDYLGLFPVLRYSMLNEKGYNECVTELAADNGVEFHQRWIADVEKKVPPEKLLKFSVTEGWNPLCKFLDVPIPEEPFPRVNSSQAFIDRLGKRMRRSWLLFYEITTIPALIGIYYLYLR